MKTSTIVLIAVGGIVGVYIVSKLASSSSSAAAVAARNRAPSSPSYSQVGSFLGGLIGGAFSSHGASSPTNAAPAALSAGDKAIFDTVTNRSTGAVDLSGVYDNSGIVDTIGDVPS